jgi:hypothetical protein
MPTSLSRPPAGRRFATWLTSKVTADQRAELLAAAETALGELLVGNKPVVSEDVSSLLCSALDLPGSCLQWSVFTTYQADPGTELFQLAVLAVPTLTKDDIRALCSPLLPMTVGVTAALVAHPVVDDELVLDVLDTIRQGAHRANRLVSPLGPLGVLSRFSPAAASAVTVIGLPDGLGLSMPSSTFQRIVAVLAAAGMPAREAFTVFVADRLNNRKPLSSEQMMGYAATAAQV